MNRYSKSQSNPTNPIKFGTRDFEYLLRSLYQQIERGDVVSIDLSPYDELDLGALANLLVLAIALRSGSLGTVHPPIDILLPNNPKAARMLFKCGFFRFACQPDLRDLFLNVNELQREEGTPTSDNVLLIDEHGFPSMPFNLIVRPWGEERFRFAFDTQKFCWNLQETFRSALQNVLGIPAEEARAFWIPSIELIENIYKHSKASGFGAIRCTKENVVICYADTGIGIMQSLDKIGREIATRKGKDWSEQAAITLAFEDGLTSLPGESGGKGLPLTKFYTLRNSGTLQLRSGSTKVLFSSKAPQFAAVNYLPGTQIRIEIPKRRTKS